MESRLSIESSLPLIGYEFMYTNLIVIHTVCRDFLFCWNEISSVAGVVLTLSAQMASADNRNKVVKLIELNPNRMLQHSKEIKYHEKCSYFLFVDCRFICVCWHRWIKCIISFYFNETSISMDPLNGLFVELFYLKRYWNSLLKWTFIEKK